MCAMTIPIHGIAASVVHAVADRRTVGTEETRLAREVAVETSQPFFGANTLSRFVATQSVVLTLAGERAALTKCSQ